MPFSLPDPPSVLFEEFLPQFIGIGEVTLPRVLLMFRRMTLKSGAGTKCLEALRRKGQPGEVPRQAVSSGMGWPSQGSK